MPPAGIVRPGAPVRRASGSVVGIDLDVRRHRFLRDHLVDGRPLLSTVMGIETIACAVRVLRPGEVIASVSNVRVGPPYFVSVAGTGRVEVSSAGGSEQLPTVHAALRDPSAHDPSGVHFAADVTTAEMPLPAPATRRVPGRRDPRRGVHAEQIYGLFFHGESFRVLDRAWLEGEASGGKVVVGCLARDLPPIVDPARPSVMAPLLIELCLQSAGLWDLAVRGLMTIPHSIERIVRYTDADSSTPGLTALAHRRAGSESADGSFDAAVVDERGTVHLAVEGYRTTEFPHPHDVDAAARIRRSLGVPP